uniref:C-type lectin domain-containing protein n=1 Tax=Ditylenchus dipsaci TaxID=166011 RepID=A0A915E8I0_9BILA
MAMTLPLVICCLFLFGLAICKNDKTCLDGWTMNYSSGYCYKKFSEKLSFDEAEASCEEIDPNSHLASFSSKEEFDFLAAIDDPYAFWIGMRHNGVPKEEVDILEKNRFDVWFVDGSPDYHFFDEDYGHYWGNTSMPGTWNIHSIGWEPNGHDEQEYQCVNLYSLSAHPSQALYQGKMNDVGCDEQLAYVCKTEPRQQTSTVESTTEATSTTELSTADPSTTPDSSSTIIETTSTKKFTTGTGVEKCLDGWSYFQGSDSCFKKFSEKLSFDKAEASCQKAADNSHLASFGSQEEFDFLAEIYDPDAFWIGMKHNGIPKKFSMPLERDQFDVFFTDGSWKDAKPSHFLQHGHEPNGDRGQPQCIHLFSKKSEDDENTYRGKMNDGDCDEKLAYVCKTKAEKHDGFRSARLADSSETSYTIEPTTEGTSPTETSAENTRTIDQQKCLDGWSYFQGSDNCFKTFSEKLSFDEAEASCQQSTENAHLASFSSREEFTFLAETKDTNAFWIGMKHNGTSIEEDEDVGKNRFDVWFIDGSPDYHFSDKDYGFYWLRIYSTYYEPNGNSGQAQCVHMLTGVFFYGATHGKMNDGDCDEKLAYVCKVKAKVEQEYHSTTESTTHASTEILTESTSTTEASTSFEAITSTESTATVWL